MSSKHRFIRSDLMLWRISLMCLYDKRISVRVCGTHGIHEILRLHVFCSQEEVK